MTRSFDECIFRIRATGERAIHDFDKRRLSRCSGKFQITRNRGTLRRESFPAIVAATRTRDRRAAADDHVSELARRAALTAIHLTVENDSRAHAFCNEDEYEVARVEDFGATKPQLSEGNSVCVVVDHNRQAEE